MTPCGTVRRVKRSRGSWRGVALALLVGAGCGGGHASKPTSPTGPLALSDPANAPMDLAGGRPFVSPGERMTYRLAIFKLEVGVFSVAVGDIEEVQGRRAIVVQAGVHSTGVGAMLKKVRTDFAAWVDVETGRPVLARVVETAGRNNPAIETSEARFHATHDGKLPIAMTRADGTEVVEDQTVSGVVWDVPSIMLFLRGWDAEPGTEMTAQVMRSQYVWRGQFRVAKRESRVTELGQLPTVRIDAIARRMMRDGTWEPKGDVRKVSIWITDDADRVPVLVVAHTDFGDVRMEIVEYQAGAANLRSAAAP